MKIVFESSPKRFSFPFRIIGSAGRYDTISDCEFLDDSHIVCVDRQMSRLYLVSFSLNTSSYEIKDSVECVIDNKSFHFELMTIRGNTIYSVSYTSSLFSCEVVDGKFQNMRVDTVCRGEAYHGICNAGDDSVYVTNMIHASITEYNTVTKKSCLFPCTGGVRMKDVAVIDDTCLLVLSSDSGPIKGELLLDGTVSPYNKPYDSHLLLYARRGSECGKLLGQLVLEQTQIDACIYTGEYCFVTFTDARGSGYLLRCCIDTNYNFTDVTKIPCAGFPHGVAVRGELFAYTSYTESALYIGRINSGGGLSVDLDVGDDYTMNTKQ
jgi:hypothetical protein